MQCQIHTSELTYSHGVDRLLVGIDLTVGPTERVGLVGPNGCGKSTLLSLLAGQLTPASGTVSTTPNNALVGLMTQDRSALPGETVGQLIARQTGIADANDRLEAATVALSTEEPGSADLYDSAFDRWMRLGAADLDARAGAVLADIGEGRWRDTQALMEREVQTLSGGERAKVWLGVVTLAQYDIMLLDEPTNDLDLAGVARLESVVLAQRGPVVVVSHDRKFLAAIVTDVVEFDPDPRANATTSVHRFGGGWDAFLEEREVRRDQAVARFDQFTTERDRLQSRAATTREWSAKGVKAERKPPDNDRSARGFRLDASEKLASKARQSERALERLESVDRPWVPWRLDFTIGEIERSGDLVAELAGAVVEHGEFRLGPVDFAVLSGQRILLDGANGAGKSTLIRALLGQTPLAAGSQRMGRSVVFGELDQGRGRLATSGRLLDRFMEDTGLDLSDARSILAKFGLSSEHVGRPSNQLSPGEQTRAVLAAFQAKGVNTVILDEPTNHLDLEAIEQLESALAKFSGTLLVVSHDRAFIEALDLTDRYRLADGVLAS